MHAFIIDTNPSVVKTTHRASYNHRVGIARDCKSSHIANIYTESYVANMHVVNCIHV